MTRVTIAVVTYRSTAELPACLDSILASDIPTKIVVIDNSPPGDGSLAIAQDYARKHSNIVAMASGGNIGLAAANNLVIPHIAGDFVLMLNPDSVVRPTTISTMVTLMDRDPTLGVVGPRHVYGDGEFCSSYAKSWTLWQVFLWRALPYSITRRLSDSVAYDKDVDVFYVSGSCLLIRAPLFRDIGGYDPAFFLTIEDVCDLCRRVRERGYRVVFSAQTELTHYTNRSADQARYLTVISGYKGSIYYFTKYNGALGGLLAYLIVTIGCAGKILVSLLKLLVRWRPSDRNYLKVYSQVLLQLLRHGPGIAKREAAA
jgi:GT2 family glycosyltransferase